MTDFFKGMFYVVFGIRYLFTKGIKRFVIMPLLFNVVLFIGAFYLIYHYFFPYIYSYTDQLPSWLSFLSGVALLLFVIGYFLLFVSLFVVLFNLIAAPFNGLLAEKAQYLLFQSTIPVLSLREIALRTLKRQGQFLLYFLPRLFGMLVLFFIPFIHPVYPFLWFLFSAWILSLQYQDLVMDNNLISFQNMKITIKERKMLALGFGCTVNLMSFVPFLNLLIIPAAVIGGVVLYCEENHPNHRRLGANLR